MHICANTLVKGSARRLVGSVASFSVLLAGVYTSLSYIGINASVLLVPAGTVGVGLGLGLRSWASNYIAGIVILHEHTFKDGDLINVNGVKGTVLEIGLRATLVRTEDNTEVIIPNSLLISRNLEKLEPEQTS